MPLRVVVIVEGNGEVDGAIRRLFERIWYEHLGGDWINVMPWRGKQGQLLKEQPLRRTVQAAAIKLHATDRTDLRRVLFILIDTEGKPECCPKTLAPQLLHWARTERSDTDIACVLPNVAFETWFAAAAESLRGQNDLPDDLPKPEDPESKGLGKRWIKKHLPRKYKETIDQAKFVDKMSLTECEVSSQSFRKLIKELRARLRGPNSATAETVRDPNEPKPSKRVKRRKKRGKQ